MILTRSPQERRSLADRLVRTNFKKYFQILDIISGYMKSLIFDTLGGVSLFLRKSFWLEISS